VASHTTNGKVACDRELSISILRYLRQLEGQRMKLFHVEEVPAHQVRVSLRVPRADCGGGDRSRNP
jgi:hypothetical protein